MATKLVKITTYPKCTEFIRKNIKTKTLYRIYVKIKEDGSWFQWGEYNNILFDNIPDVEKWYENLKKDII